jgi:hypothetical protein
MVSRYEYRAADKGLPMKISILSTLATMFVTTIDDRYVGSCPADMKPGDAAARCIDSL